MFKTVFGCAMRMYEFCSFVVCWLGWLKLKFCKCICVKYVSCVSCCDCKQSFGSKTKRRLWIRLQTNRISSIERMFYAWKAEPLPRYSRCCHIFCLVCSQWWTKSETKRNETNWNRRLCKNYFGLSCTLGQTCAVTTRILMLAVLWNSSTSYLLLIFRFYFFFLLIFWSLSATDLDTLNEMFA